MRLALPCFFIAALSFTVVVGVGCSAPPIDGPPLMGAQGRPGPKKRTSSTSDRTTSEELSEDTSAEDRDPAPPRPNDEQAGGPQPAPPIEAGAAPAPATGECAPNTTADACFKCCETAHPLGIRFLQQAFGDCACSDGAASCALECGDNWCLGDPATAACAQCLDTSACAAEADGACEKNTNCARLFRCDEASQCASKP
jgi:hypothetical protein